MGIHVDDAIEFIYNKKHIQINNSYFIGRHFRLSSQIYGWL